MDRKHFPKYGLIGLVIIIISWYLNWTLNGLRTHIGFFPLWFGYCIFIDSIVYYRTGTSLIKRSKRLYILLFLISAPSWWLFELINTVTQNWFYLGREDFTDWEYAILATISFSTVMPAVFSTAELVSSFDLFKKYRRGLRISKSSRTTYILVATGTIMLGLILNWPTYFYPFVWGSIFLIIEPFNIKLGNRSLLNYTVEGNWSPILNLVLGCLICGFFWEMWNYYSYPKWIYDAPYVNFAHIFEMPLIGFIGYIPFSFELFSLFHLFSSFINNKHVDNYIKL